ncbi:hypothetical protein D9756_004236 [Leucocoprinus leucothites]|uniref:SAGA-associated factor 11 n=1 Tax=Leucocoprinus leucothites TaxID=201217 RepID=A0A8H5LE03_9AGAR|nr:hypothetical protein D9756_004236 [Leucoagaricus leucothites]
MPTKSSEKEEMLNALSKRIFSAMLDELIFDVAIEAHHEAMKAKSVCSVCHTRYEYPLSSRNALISLVLSFLFDRCGSVHTPQSNGATAGGSQTSAAAGQAGSSSRGDTPSSETGNVMSLMVNDYSYDGNTQGGGGGSGSGSKDGTILLDCVVCQRQIASSRYAPHLASCMGLSSARRAPSARTSGAGGKPKVPSDAGRSASPASEAGSDERVNGKGKEKAKSKLPGENEGSLKRKRTQSPQTSPAKTKKAKASGSPVSRVKAEPGSTAPLTSHYTPSSTGTKSKIPSRLRESSTTSFLDRSPTTVSSRSTSPAATPASSALSAATHSPRISSRVINSHSHQSNGHTGANSARGRSKAVGTGPPPRRPAMSPPRPPPPPAIHHSVVPDYGMHDGGDETGSSTDTDSD